MKITAVYVTYRQNQTETGRLCLRLLSENRTSNALDCSSTKFISKGQLLSLDPPRMKTSAQASLRLVAC